MLRTIIIAAAVLTAAAVVGTSLVAFSFQITREQIAANERQALLESLSVLIPRTMYDNHLFTDVIKVTDKKLLGTAQPLPIYRARKAGKPVAVVMNVVAPDGYNGKIHLLVGINYEGILLGVRVVSHQETPGLGDMIEARRSNWILSFNGLSLNNLSRTNWKVKRDGGVFDQFAGATITPRAVVKAVHNALVFFKKNRAEIFAQSKEKQPVDPLPS